MDRAINVFEWIFHSIFAEAFAMTFLLGFALFLVGFLFCALFALSRLSGRRTEGKVVGAVMHERTKLKTVDGEHKEVKKKTLYPVFEYQRSDGTRRQERASEGGSATLKYQTGQSVNLIVREDEGYDDVYDADDYGALYIGLILLVVGAVVMVTVGSAASAIGVSLITLVLVIAARMVMSISSRPTKPTRKKRYSKAFDPSDLKPVESFRNPRAS